MQLGISSHRLVSCPWVILPCSILWVQWQLYCIETCEHMRQQNNRNWSYGAHWYLKFRSIFRFHNRTAVRYCCFDSFLPKGRHLWDQDCLRKLKVHRSFWLNLYLLLHPIFEQWSPMRHWKRLLGHWADILRKKPYLYDVGMIATMALQPRKTI